MATATERTFSWLVQADQWARCTHERTALLPDGTIELNWTDDDADGPARDCAVAGGSLAFDARCRAYRSHPARGRVDVLPAGSGGAGAPSGDDPRGVLAHPTGLAVDRRQRLYIVETGADAVRVVDLVSGQLLRRVAVPHGHPIDVAAVCGHALVLVRSTAGDRLYVLDGRRGARAGPLLVRPCFPGGTAPLRIAAARDGSAGGPLVLWRANDGRCAVARPNGTAMADLDGATDLDLGSDGRLVVAFGAGRPIRDYQIEGDALLEREPLRAPGFDGVAVAIAPDGRVGFTTAGGYAWTAGTAARRATSGRVVTYRLDSQSYRTRWGRVFVDACLPHATSLAMRFLTTDADVVLDPITATPPERGAREVLHPEATPTQAPAHLLDAAREGRGHRPFRRPNGSEQPWPLPGQRGRLQTYELPVHAAPGRYLWIEVLLEGTSRVSPVLGPLRVERPGHRLLAALPRAWSRRDDDADFLHRFLGPAEGLLHELDRRAADRAALVDPRSTPSETLAWLSSFAALGVDRRWSEAARRTLLAEIYPLLRQRGTLGCLQRLIEIYLGVPPTLIENWRLRGLAGTVLGVRPGAAPPETVGGTGSRSSTLGRFAVGGRDERAPRGAVAVATGERLSTSYDVTAHRFAVLVPGCLSDEQREVLADILDDHRPAHTVVEICELGEGMRIGQTVRLGLTAYVGPTPDPEPVAVGRTGVGVDSVIGSPAPGSRLDAGSHVGAVRVG